jgi:NAD-dependent SIR2 family protein deacetylase
VGLLKLLAGQRSDCWLPQQDSISWFFLAPLQRQLKRKRKEWIGANNRSGELNRAFSYLVAQKYQSIVHNLSSSLEEQSAYEKFETSSHQYWLNIKEFVTSQPLKDQPIKELQAIMPAIRNFEVMKPAIVLFNEPLKRL